MTASASATSLAPRSYRRCFESAPKWSIGMKSTLQIGMTNLANPGIDIHIDADSLIGDNFELLRSRAQALGYASLHI